MKVRQQIRALVEEALDERDADEVKEETVGFQAPIVIPFVSYPIDCDSEWMYE